MVVKDLLYDGRLRHWLIQRGASSGMADDLLADVLGDCFAGEKARGGQHRLLGSYNGGCRLFNYLRRVVVNRLISHLRKPKRTVSLDPLVDEVEEGRAPIDKLSAPVEVTSEDPVTDLLREAVMAAFARVQQENLVLFRLFHSYGIRQQKIAAMWQVNYSTLSRRLSHLQEELRDLILAEVTAAEPSLKLEWEDFVELCSESIDLFDY